MDLLGFLYAGRRRGSEKVWDTFARLIEDF